LTEPTVYDRLQRCAQLATNICIAGISPAPIAMRPATGLFRDLFQLTEILQSSNLVLFILNKGDISPHNYLLFYFKQIITGHFRIWWHYRDINKT